MARKRQGIGPQHKRILRVIEKYNTEYGYPPTIREICVEADISSTSVASYYLDRLEELQYISRDKNVSRGVRILKTAADAVVAPIKQTAQYVQTVMDEMLKVQILGRIVAGAPIPVPGSDFTYFDPEHAVEVARSMVPRRDESKLFALEVEGDSMIDAMVNDGDIVIMQHTNEARNGDMVAVWLADRDETTLKYFFREGKRVKLQPANQTMQPIYVDDTRSLQIQGKVVMVIRQMEKLN
jgi:repressor LexA